MMPRKHRVMWLIKGLGTGGAERLLTNSLPHLDRDRFEYTVTYLLPWKDDLVRPFEQAGVPVTCLNIRRTFDPRSVTRLARLLREQSVDVLHVHSPIAAVIARLAARFGGRPKIVYTEHNVIDVYHPLTRLAHRLTWRADRAVIAVSQEVKESIVRRRLLPAKPARVIHGGVEVETPEVTPEQIKAARLRLSIPDGVQVIGNVAHLRPEKAHGDLLLAARRVLETHPEAVFVIVGREKTPGDQAALERRSEELGVADNVIFAGFQPDSLAIIAGFDVFVLSSLFEGLPVALLEAMSLKRMCVVTSVGGIPEVIEEGVNGYMVKPRDTNALADRISRVLDDPGLRRRLGDRAADTVARRFTIERMVREIEEVYDACLTPASESTNVREIADSREAQ